ncbi:tRNA (guanosine(46)-N7)-methyltransferase TrmB [uncultured Muribaculum sp.]|uniref:tRNA (guanosine(46)-N7)-methyltransferase TrmB n=1 Tax=uncultured Muribaculum sp. TaxID=1918613 RepID=UPI002619FC13|nr:tRNA (guanosine(46)-N7)-methyltransferase TrmB [uncultured Muribaculum sp.]
MGKNKLRKFNEVAQMDCVFQYPYGVLKEQGFPLKGEWNKGFFHNDNPVVLELGCGKGEYTVGLAGRFPDKNFIGIDIKGARIWTGARQVTDRGIPNAAFLRTNIELLPYFFAPGEVDEIWITFPDPQMKKVNKRLTGTRFMELYRRIMKPGGVVHLKTDSPFLYTYTGLMTALNSLEKVADTSDLYASPEGAGDILGIRTFYEQQWLDRGLTIKYIAWRLDHETKLAEPQDEIAPDTYRSFSRGELQMPDTCGANEQ